MLALVGAWVLGGAVAAHPLPPPELFLAASDEHSSRFHRFRGEGVGAEPGASSAWVPVVAAGSAVAIAGGVSWYFAKQTENSLRSGDPDIGSPEELDQTIRRGQLFEKLGYIGVGVGLAGIVTGVGLAVFSAGGSAHVSIAPTRGGGALVFSGALP